MRVVAGEYGGRKLKAVPGMKTRPTTDKVKEAIFNMIGPYFDGGIALDLFAGSGGLSIEAVSRGVAQAYLVDRQAAAIKTIQENVAITKEVDKFKVIKGDANRVLSRFSAEHLEFDYLFLDPPYREQQIVEQLETMLKLNLLSEQALVICETDAKLDLPDQIESLQLKRQQKYGETMITIYHREGNEADE